MQGVIQIHLAFDHASGQEMQGKRYALVVSPQAFNRFDLHGFAQYHKVLLNWPEVVAS